MLQYLEWAVYSTYRVLYYGIGQVVFVAFIWIFACSGFVKKLITRGSCGFALVFFFEYICLFRRTNLAADLASEIADYDTAYQLIWNARQFSLILLII